MYSFLIKDSEAFLVSERDFDKFFAQETFPAKEYRENTHAILSYSEEQGVYWNYIPFTPSELREQAYKTEKLIAWNEEMLTVDEANEMWEKYEAEGNEKASELTVLISAVKAEIRERYPDEEGANEIE